MQTDPKFFAGNATHAYEVGGYSHLGDDGAYGTSGTAPFCPAVAGRKHEFFGPDSNELEFQPLEACPKNFIICDQTDNRSRVMFHPVLAKKFSYRNSLLAQEHGKNPDKYHDSQGKMSSSLKEDTEEINALLSSGEEEEEAEDDVVSTGRTPGNWKGSYRYSSSSTEGSKSQQAKSSSAQSSFCSSASSSEKKRDRMKKMVKTLRGIIPGGDDLDTPAILNEAVKYLKSLKMEAKKLGIENLEE